MDTYKIVLISFSLIIASLLYAEGDSVDTQSEINPKLLKLSVKKICQKTKIRSKEAFPSSEGGVDYSHDDRSDNVRLTITVENRNQVSVNNYTIIVEIYAKSAVEKRPFPFVFKNFTLRIPEIESRKKYVKELGKDEETQIRMIYDKSKDTYAKTYGNTTTTLTTPPFGRYFYGYRVTLLDPTKQVVQTVLWPSSLKSALEKLKQKKAEELKAKK